MSKIKPKKKKTGDEDEVLKQKDDHGQTIGGSTPTNAQDPSTMTIYMKVKYFGGKRYRKGSVKYVRYTELAFKYFMGKGQSNDPTDLRISLDEISKSDAVIFAYVLQDFMHLETIQFWSEIVSPT